MRFPGKSNRGSLTLVALCFTTVTGLALATYIAVCYRSVDLSTREFHSKRARYLAEVGLEEALWSLNQSDWTTNGAWTGTINKALTFTGYSFGQGATGQVAVTVANYASTTPTITAASTVTLNDGRIFSKTLVASTKATALFGYAISSANSYVSFISGGTVDSWDSNGTAAPYSFTVGNASNYAAVVAGKSYDSSNAVVINQAQIYGYVATFGKGLSSNVSSIPKGRVIGPTTSAAVDVDPNRLSKSAFIPVSLFTVTTPSLVWPNYLVLNSNLSSGGTQTVTSSDPAVCIPSTWWDLSITGTLIIDRPVTLIVQNTLSISSTGRIVVTANGSLQVFVAYDGAIGGNGIQNQTNDPKKVSLFFTDTSSVNTIRYTTTNSFYGVIYSARRPIDIRQNATFYGALLCDQGYISFSTSATSPVFHYDTALRNVRFNNVSTPFIINQLTEL